MSILESAIRVQRVETSRVDTVDMDNIPFGRAFSDHMLVIRYDDGAWGVPEIIPYGPLGFSPAISALNYGQAIFEGMKVHQGPAGEALLFRPTENLRRINDSAARLCMPQLPQELFMDGLKTLIDLDRAWIPAPHQGSLYLRPLMFATDEYIGVKASESYIFTIFTCPVGAYYNQPVSLLATKDYIRAAEGGTGAAKAAGNYAGALLPDKLAKAQGYDNVLWLDGREHSYVEECGTMNIFFVIDDTVITPALSGTILPGITRKSILHLLRHHDYKVETRRISIYEVLEAYKEGRLQDAFGVGTAAAVTHVARIGFGGQDILLPSVEDRPISNWLKEQINGLRYGRVEDSFDWLRAV